MHDHSHIFIKGFIGTFSAGVGAMISNLNAVEQWLRIASLVAGISVAIITFISIVRKKRDDSQINHNRRRRHHNHENK